MMTEDNISTAVNRILIHSTCDQGVVQQRSKKYITIKVITNKKYI